MNLFFINDNGSSKLLSSMIFLLLSMEYDYPSCIISPLLSTKTLSHTSSIISKSWLAITIVSFKSFIKFITIRLDFGSKYNTHI